MSNTSRIIQIPVLFDMSGSSLVFGEEATGDFVDSHLQFLLDMTTEANGISLNASDISSSILVGDQDSGDNLFWDGDANGIGIDNLCNRIAKAITRGKLVHIPSIGNFSNSGIPIGGEGHLYGLHGGKMPAGGYSKKYTTSMAPIGDEQMLGQAMARVASIHLIGDPLGSQAFEDAASIQTSLETASSQTFNQGMTAFYNALAVQLSKVLGGSKSSAPMNPGIQIGSDPVATPYDLTSQISSITGQTYSSSSEQYVDHASYRDDIAFSGISSGDSKYWLGATSTYNTGDGTYAGGTILNGVFGVNSNSWSGQWLQIDLGQTVVLSTYKIWSRRHAATYHAAPREGYLLSSIDGINWFEVHHLTLDDTTGRLLYYNAGTYGSADSDITGASNREGRYFAFVMVKAFTNCYAHANIGQLELLGVTKAEQDGGSPPTAYDVATVSSTLHSTTDNRVMSSSSRYDASFPASNAFVAGGSSSFMWASSSLTTATGEWAANHDHHVFASGVKGEWLGVDVGQNVYVTKFLIDGRHHTHAGYRYHNPREVTLYASKDDVTYYPIKSYSSPSDGSEYYTTTTGYKPLFIDIDSANPPTDEEDNRIARYFKLLIKSVMGGTQPLVKQFTIFGMKYPTDFGTAAAVTTTIYEPTVTPYDVVSSNSALTDAANHRYTASSMQHPGHATHDVSVVFDGGGTEAAKYWLSNTNAYNTTNQDGSYQGYHYTGDLSGDWVQVDLSENVLGTYYTLAGYYNTSYYHYNVKKGYLLSSLDGKKWNLAHTLNVQNETDWYEAGDGGYSVQRHVIPNSDARKGKYWRFVFNTNFGRTTNGVAGELMIYGVKYPTQVTEGNGALTTNSVLNYTLNATPYDCTSVTSSLSGQSYSVSSEATADHHLRLFDNVVGDLTWHNSGTRYNNAGDISGSYYGPHVTEGYAGEWVQVDVGRVITARNCIMSPRQHTAYTYYAPHSGVLLSSLDGLKWNLVTEWTNGVEATKGETWYNNSAWHVVNVPLSGTYSTARYFRMVFTKSSDHTGIYLCDFKILGVKHPEEVTQGEDTITTSNVPSYVPTVTPYELAGNDSILTDAANHRYTASSMYYPGHANYDVSVMFNNATSPASHYWVSQENYNNSGTNGFDGTYKGTHYTGDLSGDWFQIDLSENVYVTKAVALPYMHTAYFTYGFRKGYLLSSLDGLKWNLIHTYDEPTDDATSIYSNGTWHPYVMNITSSKNCIGRYFRFIVNKTFGATTTAYVAKFRLYGVRYPSQVTEGDGAINTTTLITYTPTVTPYEVHYLPDAANHRLSESENAHPGHSTHGVQVVFDDTPDGNNWTPRANNRYSATTGKYQGATFTNDVSGEWVQIDLSENILVDRYQYHPYRHTAYLTWQVKKGSLLSSLDGLKWELVDTFQNTDTDGSFYYNNSSWHYKDRKVSGKNTIGRYFRFVVQEGYTYSSPRIGQIRIFGTRYPSETSQGNIVVDISNNKPGYILTATPFDLTSPDSILTDAANTRYTASSYAHPGNASYSANRAFDWLSNANTGYYWIPQTATYGSTGGYQHGRTTEDSSGEWIQVDLSENVFVDNYSFIGRLHNAYVNYSVAAGTLFSSLNGTLWKEVHTFDISGTGTETYYNNNMWSAQHFNITQSENCIGRYFRFVINKSFSSYLNITNLTINGVKYPSQVTTQNILLEPALEKTIFWSTDQSASFDVASSNSTLNGQTYTTSSHHYPGNASYEVAQAFNGTLSSTSVGWVPRNGQYNSDGTYYGHSKTGIYPGEWIQVDIGQNVNITNYKIHPFSHTAYHTRNVRKTHLLSSLDGLKWNLVHTHNDTATASPYGFPSLTSPISHDLTASYTTGRYFRFVIEETHGNNYPMLSELEINGTLPNVTTNGSSFSTADRYNTFSVQNNVVPYDIYGSSLGHTVPPYIISSKNTNTTSIDIVSTSSTINGQTYSASILNANASKVFDNSNVTIFDTSGNPKYNQIDVLATNEPNFDSVALATVGAETFLDYTFTEDLTSTSDPSATDIILTTLTGANVPFQALSITAGKLRLQPFLNIQYNTNVAEYDLTSTASTLFGTRGDITYSSQYNNGGHHWYRAFDNTLNGPAITASGAYSGGNPVNAPDVVISGVTYNGHWVQLDVGQNVLVKTFEYTDRGAHPTYEWDTLLLAGSKDGTTWDLLWRATGRASVASGAKETYAVDATDVYSQFRWLCEKNHGGGYAWNSREMTLLGQTEAQSSPAPVASASNFVLQYNKSNTAAVNLVGVTNSVALNSFVVGNGAVLSRGGDNFSIYNGATSTTYNTNKTYTGEYVQVDIGSSHFIHNYEIVVPNANTWDNPKNWILLGSTNNSDWTKLDEATDYTFTSTTTGVIQTGLEVRYIRLIINKTSGPYGSFKIASLNINGATLSTNINGQTYSASVNGYDVPTVFNNNMSSNWVTGFDYNTKTALATNEPEFSSVGIHTDASGNGQLQLTFNANVSSTNINSSNFSVTSLDLSKSEIVVADISDGKIMLEKLAEITGSIFYEDFDDQNFLGEVTTADIVAGGRDGTGYCIQGHDVDPSTKYWKKIITYRAISFWHHFTNTNYNGRIWSAHFDDNDTANSALNLHHYHTHYRYAGGSQAGGGKWSKFYIDGVERTPYAHNTGITNGWHHLYLEFNVDVPQATFLAGSGSNAGRYGSADKIDEVRFFSQGIPESQIIEMANGWNGTYPGATFLNTNYRVNYIKDVSSTRLITGPEGVPINNFIIHDGTLISRGTGYGEYSASTSTTHNTNQTSTGEYVEVNIGEATLINSYTLHVKTPFTSNPDDNPNPKSWTLLGKTDGGDWTKIHLVTDYTWSTASDYTGGFQVTYYSSSIIQMVAQHYRLIINKTHSKNGYATAAELLINGVKHTSETTGITITKTASLGTASNAFDKTITNSWDTSSSATYSLIEAAATNEPTFSSGTINGNSQIELTFDTDIAISGTFNKSNLHITNSSFATQAYNASIDSGKLLLTYNAEQLPTLDTIFFESFDDQTTTDPLGAVGSIVAGGKDDLGYALKRTTTQTAAGGVVFEQTTIPENIKSMSFWAIVDETDTSTSWHNLLWIKGSAGGNWDTYILRFKDNALGQGTSEQKHMVEKYYIDGVLCGGATLSTSYDSDITEGGNPVTEDSFKGTWRHIYLEWQLPINDPNVTNSFVSNIFWMSHSGGGYAREGRIDDIRFYGQALTESQITTLATNNLGGTFSGSLTDYNIQYTKSNDGNLVNATHTSVDVNSFTLMNGTLTHRGDTGKGEYTGTTSTTYNTDKTYTGEYVQVDMGQNILMTKYYLHVPTAGGFSNPKNWKLLCSSNGTDWTEVHDISNNSSWENSSYISTSSYGSGKQFEGSSAIHQFVGRYFRLVVNKITGSSNHVKIGELQIQGVMHTMETASDNNPIPVAATATPSDNTTTVTDSTVTSTTHLTNDTTTTTTTETRIVIAADTETTTTQKTNVGIVTTATPHFGLTSTPSNTVTTHSDNTVTSTTYANNDTTTRTLVTKTIDISANTNTGTNYNTVITKIIQAFAVSTGSSSAFNPNKMFDASGVACPALKSIYEQLMNIPGRSQIMESQDFSTSPMPSVETITGGFPFIAGDKLVMYIRPKIQFAQATFPEQFTSLIGFGDKSLGSPAVDIALASGSGGGVSGQTYTESSKYSNTYAGSKLFDGNTGSIWITASDTFNSSTQVAEEYYSGGHLFDDGGSRSLSLNNSLETLHEDFGNDNSTTTHTVTVGDNGGNKFKIDGAFNPILAFVKGNTYIFDQSDGTNSGHQIQISETAGGANTSYVTTVGTPGTAGAKTTVVVPSNAPTTLYYNCNAHGAGMGNSIGVTSQTSSGTVGAGVTYVTGYGGTGKALSTIGVSDGSPFIQSGINGSKAVSFWFYGDPTAANMNSTIMFDTRTNSGPNFALNYPDGVDNLHMWTGGGYTGIEGIYINGSLQTIDVAGYSANYGSKIGGDNTTKASLSGVWTHIFVNFTPNVTTINDVTWLSRYTSGQVTPGYLDDVRWFAGALNDAEITNLSSGGSGNIGRNMINYVGHYVQIEFTASMAAETLKLTPRNGGGGGAGEPVDFRLLVLEDDNDPTWTSVLKVTESQIQPNWNKNGNDWATHEWLVPLSTAQGKYWRLVINKISTGNKVQLAKMELMGGLTSELTGGGDQAAALSIPGLETNVTNQATTFPVLFPGNTTGGIEAEALKFGWVGSANADSLSLETTDETDTRTMDLHIWKITITL